eukprot:59731-Pyramimonas_sp.AAC.1
MPPRGVPVFLGPGAEALASNEGVGARTEVDQDGTIAAVRRPNITPSQDEIHQQVANAIEPPPA